MTSRVNIVFTYSTPFSKMLPIIHDDPSYNALTWKRLTLPLTCHIHQTKSIDPSLVIYIWLGNILQCRHNGRYSASNHQTHDCLHSSLFKCRSKKTSKLRVTGLCVGNSPVTGEFPAQMASNAEKVIIWWRHHDGGYYQTGATWCAHLTFTRWIDLRNHKKYLYSLLTTSMVQFWRVVPVDRFHE